MERCDTDSASMTSRTIGRPSRSRTPMATMAGPEPYSAIFVVRLDSVEELPHAREIAEFTTVAGKTLSPRAMRGLYVVDEIAVGATA